MKLKKAEKLPANLVFIPNFGHPTNCIPDWKSANFILL